MPSKENVWVFFLAGQSNMAGRGLVEPSDTIASERIFSVNADGEIVYAQEPLHYYEPDLTGLDCGLSFGKSLMSHLPDEVSLLILPTAVGGSSIEQWLGDSTHRNVPLMTNFKEKVAIGQQYGTLKGILWHQGESDAQEERITKYQERLSTLITTFREIARNDSLPVLLGELGGYSENNENWQRINQEIHAYAAQDSFSMVINTQDFDHKGDKVHFNSDGQREMGKRFAEAYLKLIQVP
ncbi:MAG: sialate O-acetylesterase [Cyclobacteriaceae bacterium]